MVALLLGPLDEPFLAFLIADLEGGRGHVDRSGNGDRGRLDARLVDRAGHNQPPGLPMPTRARPAHGGTPRRRGRRLRRRARTLRRRGVRVRLRLRRRSVLHRAHDPHPRPPPRPTRNRVRRDLRGRVHRLSPPARGRRARRHLRRRCRARLLRDDRGRPVRPRVRRGAAHGPRTVVHRVGNSVDSACRARSDARSCP